MKTLYRNMLGALRLTAAAVVSVAACSCDDLLDTKPQGTFTSEQIGDEEALQLMTSAYAALCNHFIGNNEAFAGPINNWVFDVRSDDAVKGGDGPTMEGYIYQMEIGNIQSDNDSGNFKWLNDYYAIARCNVALSALREAAGISESARAQYISEMQLLRSFYYFDLLRIFQRFPYITELDANPSSIPCGNLSKDEVLAQIKDQLATAYNNLPEEQPQVGRYNRYVAAALMARVCLWTHDWGQAEYYANEVIASGKYHLYQNFLDMSDPTKSNTMESVMAIQFIPTIEGDVAPWANWSNCINCTYSDGNLYGNGDDFYLGSQNLVNSFRTGADGLPMLDGSWNDANVTSVSFSGNVDPRLDFTLGRIGMYWRGHMYTDKWVRNMSFGGQYSGKKPYTAPESPYCQTGVCPWGANTLPYMVIRYADVLLMKAEAIIEQNGDLGQARSLINEVRNKAKRSVDASYQPQDCNPIVAKYKVEPYPTDTPWTQDYARKAVRYERRLELAMEGHRWFDLLRWGNACEVVNAYYATEKMHHPYYDGAVLTADELYLPVPLRQVDASNGLYQ